MSEHPKNKMKRLDELLEKTEGRVINTEPITRTKELKGELNTVEIEKKSRKIGRPKGSPNKNKGFRKKDKKAMEKAAKVLWERGLVCWKLKPEQQVLQDSYKNRGQTDTITWVLPRQIGKSYSVATIIIEECLNSPGLRIAYVTPLKSQSRSIVEKNFLQILNDCPEHLKPKFDSQKAIWSFKNGSIVRVAGMDGGNIESLRGQTFDRVIIDEAGFPSAAEFEYALESVLFPTMTISDDPLLLLISTPPKTYDHPFNNYWDKAILEGNLVFMTIYDSYLSKSKVQKIEDRYGKDSIHFRREFLCEKIADTNSLVIPEATNEKIEEITGIQDRPKYCQKYVVGDFGVMDNNAFLFCYFDFLNNKVVIEEELILSGAEYDTQLMAEEIKDKELELWGTDGVLTIEPRRYCDNNLQIIRDFANLYNLNFLATAKDDKQAAINDVRVRLQSDTILIHPKCVTLINHIQNATWDKSRKKFKQAIGHHYDTLDCLIYLIRNVDYSKNPFPSNYFLKGNFISPKFKNKELSSFEKSMASMFKPKKIR